MSETLNSVLLDFGKSAMALNKQLDEDIPLGHGEQMYIENHITLVQLAYTTWKRRKKTTTQED